MRLGPLLDLGEFDGYQACAFPQSVPCPKAESQIIKKENKEIRMALPSLPRSPRRGVEGLEWGV